VVAIAFFNLKTKVMANIQNMVSRVVRENPGTLKLAQEINKTQFPYNQMQIEDIILDYLHKTKDADTVDKVVSMHPDKPFFDVYYKRQASGKSKGKDLNCMGCATFSAEGGKIKLSTNQKLFFALTGGFILSLIWGKLDNK
jgi:hypothetical protein